LTSAIAVAIASFPFLADVLRQALDKIRAPRLAHDVAGRAVCGPSIRKLMHLLTCEDEL
jgi:hypothetical protein